MLEQKHCWLCLLLLQRYKTQQHDTNWYKLYVHPRLCTEWQDVDLLASNFNNRQRMQTLIVSACALQQIGATIGTQPLQNHWPWTICPPVSDVQIKSASSFKRRKYACRLFSVSCVITVSKCFFTAEPKEWGARRLAYLLTWISFHVRYFCKNCANTFFFVEKRWTYVNM